MATMNPIVSAAINNAREAGWGVRFSSGKIVITCGDGFNLTIGQPAMENKETLRKFESKARQYNLIEGPAQTPAQREAEEKALAEKKAAAAAEKADAAARKQAEANAAKEKAKAVVAQAAKLPPAPTSPSFVEPVEVERPQIISIPTQPTPHAVAKAAASAKAAKEAESPKADADGFPPFTPDMLAVKEDYSVFKLPNGRYFCPTCWEGGVKFTAKQPQGLASHRGIRHGLFTKRTSTVPEESKLPESVATALELLRNELIESLTDTADAAQVRELEKKIEDLNKVLDQKQDKIAELTKNLDAGHEALRKLTKERDDAKRDAEGRKTLLDNERSRLDAEIKQQMDAVEQDLKQMRAWTNELAPVKAIARIDEVLTKYLGG